ncbi:M56 family metallopeptidase [Sandarakinorhabdus sp.]|uniref:M56 family metallopeptidase n=1 Tax=Sandarakinorhabdus sp. TaxID=1916663 RepID=UPI0033422F72
MMIWLIEALIGSALLMLLALLLRRPVARLWGAPFAYALWALPPLRLLLPPLPGWQPFYVPVAQANPQGDMALALMSPADAALYTQPLPAATLQAGGFSQMPDWPSLLLALWAAGALVWLAVQYVRHQRFIGPAVRDGTPLATISGVSVIMSAHVPGPMAAGIWQRRILVPADFLTRYSSAERRMTMLHEAAHHDRLDLLANFVGLLVVAAHWWNPIAHIAWRAFRADQELACDATVLAGSDGDSRAAYGQAVLKSACVATPIAACAMNHKSQLKERIAMMKDRKIGLLPRLLGGLALLGVAGAALAATASGDQSAPVPPVPPAPPAANAGPAAPAAPAAPRPPQVMVFTRMLEGKDAKNSKDVKLKQSSITTVIVKNGEGATVTTSRGDTPAMVLGGMGLDLAASGGAGSTRVMMIRREGPADMAAKADTASKAAEQHLAMVRTDLRARCDKEGISMPADADIAQLATCGMELQKRMRTAMASARTALEKSRDLSEDQRSAALKGLDAAMANLPGQMIIKLQK